MATPDPDTIEAHRESLSRMSKIGGPLRADAAAATVENPVWFQTVDGVYRPRAGRNKLHQKILEDHRALRPNVAAGKRAIILAGPPGAGKSRVRDAVILSSGIPIDHWRIIDADDFKARLLDAAIQDGSYMTSIVPQEIREAMADGERFYPLELASLVHEESSLLVRAARADAIAADENVVLDTVLSSPSTALEIGKQLRAADYEITVVEVELERDASIARSQERWREGYVKAEEGTGTQLGGRWVPEELPASLYEPGKTDSRCRDAAHGLAHSQGAVTRYEEHRVDPATGAPVLEVRYERSAVDRALKLVTSSPTSFPISPPASLSASRSRPTAGSDVPGDDLSR